MDQPPPGATTLNVKHKVLQYPLRTAKHELKNMHDAIFGSVGGVTHDEVGSKSDDNTSKALCQVMKDVLGRSSKGCESAAAFTTWSVNVSSDVYAADGTKADVKISVDSVVAVPNWQQVDKASAADAAEARRFQYQTALHEYGHALSGENCGVMVTEFIKALPAAVPASDVADMNAAVNAMIRKFYVSMAHMSDKMYDATTDHGRAQGAEALRRVADGEPPRIKRLF